MNTSEKLDLLGAALSAAQAELATAKKDSSGYGYNYSDLASVLATAKPVLEKNGLAVSQLVGQSDDHRVSLTTILIHKSGQFISQEASIAVPEMNKINATQKAGAAISYLRRYALQAILGMASEDNDASTDARPIPQASVPVKTNVNTAADGTKTEQTVFSDGSVTPPKMTDAMAKATNKAPSFSRNKTTVAKASGNDLGI